MYQIIITRDARVVSSNLDAHILEPCKPWSTTDEASDVKEALEIIEHQSQVNICSIKIRRIGPVEERVPII